MKTNTSETITLLAADPVFTLTASKYTNVFGHLADYAFLTVRSGQINYSYDGTDPSATGHLLTDNQSIGMEGADVIIGFKIKATADAVLYVTYENTQVVTAIT